MGGGRFCVPFPVSPRRKESRRLRIENAARGSDGEAKEHGFPKSLAFEGCGCVLGGLEFRALNPKL